MHGGSPVGYPNAGGARSVVESVDESRRAIEDAQRLATLRSTGLLDSQVEEQFDRLTRLAARLLGAPATFFSLVDEDRDFYKSCFGFAEPLASDRQLEGTTFCHYALVADGALVIPDTRAHPVYRNVPTVESLGVAAYLGVPVHAPNGSVLGSFCAIDFEPRDWSELDIDVMKELAQSAEREVGLREWMRLQTETLEAERAARHELEAISESRSRLVRGFTHDVRNPLGAADGFLTLLEDGIPEPLTPKQLESVSRTRRILKDALQLITDLLEIARDEAEPLRLSAKPANLVDVARDVTEAYRALAVARGLTLEFRTEGALDAVVADEARVRQIVGNLLSNAIKYTPSGSVEVVARVYGDEGSIEVSDTGPGIAPERHEALFEEFSRLDEGAAEGAGVGLFISRRLARELGGDIDVESDVGRGSTFRLTLPLGGGDGAEPDAG